MMGMHWTNWVGLLMLIILLFVHEPIWLFISEPGKILWAIPAVIYVIVGATSLIRSGPDDEET